MKPVKRLIACVLLLATLSSLLVAFPTASAEQPSASASTSESYAKRKVVSVLYDTSGSMKNFPDEYRYQYAQYAMQMLTSMLSARDTLIVTPMHAYNGSAWQELTDANYKSASFKLTASSTDYKGASFEIDLADPNRNAVIENALATTFLKEAPSGNDTPSEAIPWAVKHLVDAGMKTHDETAADEESTTEYYLVVLTDGILTKAGSSIGDAGQIAAEFRKDAVSGIERYADYQCIFLAFGKGALPLAGTSLDNLSNFTSYHAADSSDIIAAMRGVSNQISGRYALEESKYTVSGRTVTIDLSGISFGLRSLSFALQNCEARLTSAKYGGETLTVSQHSVIQPNGLPSMVKGSSAVLRRTGDDTTRFLGGTVTLTFDAPVSKTGLSILLEPSLSLSAIIEAKDKSSGEYKEIDSVYINSELGKDDEVYVSFAILDEASGKRVTIDDAQATVSYNGVTQKVASGERATVTLATGSMNISIAVSVMNGTYTMYASVPCVVLDDPTSYRIEAGTAEQYNGHYYEARTAFTVFVNGSAIYDNATLEKYSPVCTVKGPDGGVLHPSTYEVKHEGGQIVFYLNVQGKDYGAYEMSVSVRDEKGNPRSATAHFAFYPDGMKIEPVGEDELSFTLYGITQNESEGFTFSLSASGETFKIVEGVIDYRVTIGTMDVSKHCTVDGEKLILIPTDEILGELAKSVGTHKVTVTVTSPLTAKVNTSCEATLTLTDTVFAMFPVGENPAPINRFRPNQNKETNFFYFRVLRDGESLSAAELEAALASGALTASMSDYATDLTVAAVDGAAALCVQVSSRKAALDWLLTGMFVFGNERDLKASYTDPAEETAVSATSTVLLSAPNYITQYLVRILIYLYILQLIFVILTFLSKSDRVLRIPRGVLVKADFKYERGAGKRQGAKEYERMIETITIEKVVGWKDHLVFTRLIPYLGVLVPAFRKKEVKCGALVLCHDDNRLPMMSPLSGGTERGKVEGNTDPVRAAYTSYSYPPKAGVEIANEYDNPSLKKTRIKVTSESTEQTIYVSLSDTTEGLVDGDSLYIYIQF